MRKVLKAAIWVVATLAILFGALCLALSIMFSDMCGGEVFQESYSPNKEYKAIVFSYDCGASTGINTHVSILKSSSTIDIHDPGNLYAAKNHPKESNLHLIWASENLLEISNSDPNSFKKESKVKSVSVKYK